MESVKINPELDKKIDIGDNHTIEFLSDSILCLQYNNHILDIDFIENTIEDNTLDDSGVICNTDIIVSRNSSKHYLNQRIKYLPKNSQLYLRISCYQSKLKKEFML